MDEALGLSRRLLAEGGPPTASESGGLSVAWIAAIVINALLIAIFIVAIVYCYCRRKNQSVGSPVTTAEGGFGQKAANGLVKTAAVFSVEEERQRLPPPDCTCASPRCYCSTGDGHRTEETLSEEDEQVEDVPPPFRPDTPEMSPEDFWRPDTGQRSREEDEEVEEVDLPGSVTDLEPGPPAETRFLVYRVTDQEGSREVAGRMSLAGDATLREARRALEEERRLAGGERFAFLDEGLRRIAPHLESVRRLADVYPELQVHLQIEKPFQARPPTPPFQPVQKPRPLAYVGPLGVCSAAACTNAAKIKCLDCRSATYCTTRCMREDQRDHKRLCYKPAWRL